MRPTDTRRRLGFFARRRGHRLRAHQAGLMESLLPRLKLDLSKPAPGNLAALFSDPVDDTRLEIGFGGGEHLVAEARRCPRTGFIGCEPFVNGMAKALAAIDAGRITNIRLQLGDALEVVDWLPDAALGGVDLLYPDPWPKRRHWKRRIVQDETIAMLARVVRSGGLVRFATDSADYGAWTLRRFLSSEAFEWTAERADDWRRAWTDFPGTRYGVAAAREGRATCYLVFRRR